MIIQSINTTQNKKYKINTSFKAYMPKGFYRQAEKCSLGVERIERNIVNRLHNYIDIIMVLLSKLKSHITRNPQKNNICLTRENLEIIKANPLFELQTIYNVSKSLCLDKEIEINIENNELANIANDDEACIFIMNHDRQKEDPKLFAFFNALLTREYINNGLEETCPRPKILINKDIIETTNESRQVLAEALGAIGIDAGIHCANSFSNGKIISKLLKEFSEDKTNIFIFPEGKMALFRNTDPQWKFQTGIADIVKAAAGRKKQVKVIPLGFAYKKDVGSINIGKPLYFKKIGNEILFQPGDVEKGMQDKTYVDYVNNANSEDGWYKITSDGNLVDLKNINKYIAGILCESLTLSKKKAGESIKNVGSKKDTDIVYSIGDL